MDDKLITGKEAGLSLNHCIEKMKGEVAHYKVAGKDIYEKGYYRRGRSYNRLQNNEGKPGHEDIYFLNQDKEITELCYDTTYHRARVLLKALLDGTIRNIDNEILHNYAHNGFNTRTGLFKSNHKLQRIREIAKSHAEYMGKETGNSKLDHKNRVFARN